MKKPAIWKTYPGDGPLVAAAIHNGNRVRPEVANLLALGETERLREEDPFTAEWTTMGDTRIIGLQSRFEVDLNRPRDKAVYMKPEDSWGLKVWKTEPSPECVTQSLAEYDAFYTEMRQLFTGLQDSFGYFVVFDLHSYNHRRQGPGGPPADPTLNPEVNVGTGTLNRERWGSVVDRFIKDLHASKVGTRQLDVRENVKFKGGHFSRWIHEIFPDSACAMAIEFKKFFMDEWTGEPDRTQLDEIVRALHSTVPGVLEELKMMGVKWSRIE